MSKRLKRTADFELSLEIKNQSFIDPPTEAQKTWLLNKTMAEFASNVDALNGLAKRFVPGGQSAAMNDRMQELTDSEIMEDWQIPLMESMASVVAENRGHILEVGFGRGISAEFVQKAGVDVHTIIECSESVVARFEAWKATHPEADIRLIVGKWQDVTDQLDQYDGILFHTYPLDMDEYVEYLIHSVTFAEHFFPTAARHLKPGGIFTYFTGEMDSFSRPHQRLVFEHFKELTLKLIRDLPVPDDVTDAWWLDQMAVVKAVK